MIPKFYRDPLKREHFTRMIGNFTGRMSRAPNTEIGLELELEGFGASMLQPSAYDLGCKYWTFHNDPSLRGEAVELVLARPVDHKEFKGPVLEELVKMFDKSRFKPALSNRCSFHVHIDFGNKTLYDLARFIIVYSVYEQYFFAAVGPNRKGNHFCVAMNEAERFVDGVTEALFQEDWGGVGNEDVRYMALNLAALFKFGSVEIRLHEGVADPDRIERWVDVIMELVRYADSDYRENPQQFIELISMNGLERVTRDKFPKTWELIEKVFPIINIRDGLDIAQDIAYAISWENAPKEVNPVPPERRRKLSRDAEHDRLVLANRPLGAIQWATVTPPIAVTRYVETAGWIEPPEEEDNN